MVASSPLVERDPTHPRTAAIRTRELRTEERERFGPAPEPTCFRDGYAGAVETEEERIALFLDYENLAIGARESLRGMQFDFRPVADALAERGRVVVRRAYADWSYFDEDRRMLTRATSS